MQRLQLHLQIHLHTSAVLSSGGTHPATGSAEGVVDDLLRARVDGGAFVHGLAELVCQLEALRAVREDGRLLRTDRQTNRSSAGPVVQWWVLEPSSHLLSSPTKRTYYKHAGYTLPHGSCDYTAKKVNRICIRGH